MNLSELKNNLNEITNIYFKLEDGTKVPEHAHVTEVGVITRDFIDCGGIVRKEQKVNIQLWYTTDYKHRLSPQKLIDIITISENTLNIGDFEIEVEYQQNTINKFYLDFKDGVFILINTLTECLAPDSCGVPEPKTNITPKQETCTPGGGCC